MAIILRPEKAEGIDYAACLEEAAAIIVVASPDGTIRYINRRGCELLGVGCREHCVLMGADWFESAVPVEKRDEMRELFGRAFSGCAPSYDERHVLTASGKRLLVGWRYRLISGPLLLMSGEDVTARRELESALAISGSYYVRILDEFPNPIWRSGSDAKCDFFNRAWLEFTGRSMDQEMGDGWADGVHPDDLERCVKCYLEAFGRREPFVLEYRLLRNDGNYRWIVDYGIPRHTPEGEFAGYVGSCHDIDDRRTYEDAMLRAQEDLKRSAEEARAASHAKGVFLAMVSHELRTPLNGILGLSELALEGELGPEERELVGLVHESAEGLREIINDLLDYTKIEAGRFDLHAAPFSLRHCIRHSIEPLNIRARSKGIGFSLDVANDVPDALVADHVRLRQVILNLAGNAVKFTEQGSVSVMVKLESEAEDSAVIGFAVSDTGGGIPEDQAVRIFRPFEQAEMALTRKHGGTGLGLAVSASLVRLMGSEIKLRSELEKGSTFSFSVRLLKDPAPAAQEPGRAAEAASTRKLKVLVAEDNPINRKLARMVLERSGHRVTEAADGYAALGMLDDGKYDAMLLDIMMPGIDGYEVARQVRSMEASAGSQRLPIVAMTAHAMKGERERCIAEGMDGYVAKPMKAAELLAELQSVVSTRQSPGA